MWYDMDDENFKIELKIKLNIQGFFRSMVLYALKDSYPVVKECIQKKVKITKEEYLKKMDKKI